MILSLIRAPIILEQFNVTPSDMKAIRLRLGLDMAELAQLLGLAGRRDIVENLEKARTWTMHQGHIDAITRLEMAFEDILEDEIDDVETPEVLIGFPNDGVFAAMEPALCRQLRFNSVHRMLNARLQEAFAEYDDNDGQESKPPIVEIIPAKYESWLDGRTDTIPHRKAWALQHLSVYKVKPGLPTIGHQEE